jgi:hypothetical protein
MQDPRELCRLVYTRRHFDTAEGHVSATAEEDFIVRWNARRLASIPPIVENPRNCKREGNSFCGRNRGAPVDKVSETDV